MVIFFVEDAAQTEINYPQEIANPSTWQSKRRSAALSPDAIVNQATLVAEAYGFHDFKLKGGVFAPEFEIDCIHALKQAFPKAKLTLDLNGCWSLETSLKAAEQLKGAVAYIEDPCGAEGRFSSREIMAEFRQQSGIPTATNMVATDSRELAHAIRLSAVDIPLADPHFWGMEGAVQVSRICQNHGLTWGAHSNNHFDISLAMVTHTAAASTGKITAIDTHWIWQEGQHLSKNPLKFNNGMIDTPQAPGLGIEIDRIAIERAHQLYINNATANRDDSLAMQVLIPDWKFDSKRPCMVR